MNIYEQRLSRLRIAMIDTGLDALVITPGAGMRYLTGFSEEGFERLLCLIVPVDRDWLFITPSVNGDQTKNNAASVSDVRVWSDTEGWQDLFAEAMVELDLTSARIGVDDNMAARFLLPIMRIVPDASLTSAGEAISDLRMQKDAAELDALQRAADLTDLAYLAGLEACVAGATELDVAKAIDQAIFDGGGTLSFETIVAAGENSALPHHGPGKRVLATGDVVTLDLGARVDGYCGDITRIVAIGEPTVEASAVYEIVRQAQAAGVAAARPGVTAESVDQATRTVIEAAGFGAYFIHRTGHGIGLDDHELPNIVAGNDHLLRPGECFSVEPGIYLPGKFGIRLENIVTVTEKGSHVFNRAIPETMAVKL